MSTANVLVMIDHLVGRYGLSGAAGRAQCLTWVQLAEEDVWGAGMWWFKQQRQDVAMSAGVREYALSTANGRIHALEQGGGGEMTRLHPDDFRSFIGNDMTGGYPELWCNLEPNSTGYPRVMVWPVPEGTETLKAVYDKAVTTLADSTGSVSKVPADWRHLVLLRAEVYASLHLGQQGQAQGFMKAFEEGLAALRELNSAQLIRL